MSDSTSETTAITRPVSAPAPAKLSHRWEWASENAISYLMQQAVENQTCLSLAAGLVDQASLPVKPARQALEALLADDETARHILQYGTTAGSETLRRVLLEHLARLEQCEVSELGADAQRLVLTTGSQQLLSIVAELLFDPGDICLVAAPTYFVFLGVLNGLGVRAVPVDTDENGMRPDALEATLHTLENAGELERVKLIYLVSYFENPSGVSLGADRRRTMVELAKRWSKTQRLFILEDAAYRELNYDGDALPSVWSFDAARTHVILAQTFSKSFSPGVRVGFGVLPVELVSPACDLKGNEDFGSAHLNQHLIARVFQQGLYYPHVAALRDSYRVKRDAMLAAAEEFFGDIDGVSWFRPHGGLYVWMTFPDHIETGFQSPLFQRATTVEQVMYVPGELCFAGIAEERPRNHARLSFGVLSPESIREGMRRLASATRSVLE